MYMIEHGNKKGGQIYQKHKFKKTNKQTDRRSGKTDKRAIIK